MAAGMILYFKVADIVGTHAALEGKGGVFSVAPHLVAKMPDHDLWMAAFADLDDHTLQLMSEVGAGQLEEAEGEVGDG